ncbi:hypothetical protein A0O34_15415 [Chryseobacterium glaciei]|uniref:Uncharacterized protein n=1 Tax=Chryseobacterium glaciei TaxID=1685010 RepID=A0A172XY50_9FLAO|nr:hypothetical protein A0O34_15415 [Chryseobacterium glaciei]
MNLRSQFKYYKSFLWFRRPLASETSFILKNFNHKTLVFLQIGFRFPAGMTKMMLKLIIYPNI